MGPVDPANVPVGPERTGVWRLQAAMGITEELNHEENLSAEQT